MDAKGHLLHTIHILHTHARALSQTHLDKNLICNSRTGKALSMSPTVTFTDRCPGPLQAHKPKEAYFHRHVSISENPLLQDPETKAFPTSPTSTWTAPQRWMLRATIMCIICFYMSVIVLSFSAKTRPATKLPFTAVCCQDATSMSFAMQWPAACQAGFALLAVYAVVFCCCSQKRYAITPSCVAPVRPKQLAYRRLCNKAWPLT